MVAVRETFGKAEAGLFLCHSALEPSLLPDMDTSLLIRTQEAWAPNVAQGGLIQRKSSSCRWAEASFWAVLPLGEQALPPPTPGVPKQPLGHFLLDKELSWFCSFLRVKVHLKHNVLNLFF